MFSSKAAVVGTGFIAPVHIEALLRAGVRVRGVLGTTLKKSQHVADRFGIERAYSDYQELLSDDQVDVVHLTSPNRYHYSQAIQAMEAGKHVLCEKPLAMNSTESAELVRRAALSPLKTGVNYNVRFYPVCIEAAERVRSGEIGDIFHVSGCYVQDWLHQPTDFNWRVLGSEGGSLRALADIGTHWLDLVQSITGLEVASVCADLQTVHPIRQRPVGEVETFSEKMRSEPLPRSDVTIDTEDYGAVLIRFRNGARGTMHVSQVTAGHKNTIRFEVAGSHQSIGWNSQHPDELWIGNRNKQNEIMVRDPALMSSRASRHASYPGGHNEGFPDTFKQLFRSFYSAIAGDTNRDWNPYPTFADGHREILLCEAILASANEQRWVNL